VKYCAEIDGLRAIAVVAVILFRAGFDLFSVDPTLGGTPR
jgi:peptidoglycan/LPS O-acetylase OafA/YrhL